MNLPNTLTLIRIFLVPLLVVVLLTKWGGPLLGPAIFGAAVATDWLDGYLARRRNQITRLGILLDPLADKLLVMAALVWMVPMGRIPEWAVVLLLAREISITGLRSIASSEGLVISAGSGGKNKTALQMVGILCLMLGYPYEIDLWVIDLGRVDLVVVGRALIYISLIFSVQSALSYLFLFARASAAKPPTAAADADD